MKHGYRLEWVGSDRLPWCDAVALIEQQPPQTSAVYRALYPNHYDRDRVVRVLEDVAVLTARVGQSLIGVPDEQLVGSYRDLVAEPEPVGLPFDQIDKLMGVGRG